MASISRAYAETGIPVFLVIDRAQASVVVYSDPDGQTYRNVQNHPVGAVVPLPAPVSAELDTEPLREWIG